jgi:DNA-binding CsgD family transcriptional regulator
LFRGERKPSDESAQLELELLGRFARGLTMKEAALEMKISQQKAYRIRQMLMESAGAKNAQDLTRYAMEIGLAGRSSRTGS